MNKKEMNFIKDIYKRLTKLHFKWKFNMNNFRGIYDDIKI